MSNTFLRASLMIVVVTMVGRLLSFFRNVFLTNKFGVGIETDAYLMAYTIPLLLFLVVPGAINSVLIPTLKGFPGVEHVARRNELFQKSLTIIVILFFFITAAGMLWASQLVSVLAPGFEPDKHAMTVELLRIMLPSALFIGIIAVISSVLNAHFEFFAPSFGTVINGIVVIVSIYTLAPMLGIYGVAWGTTAGYLIFAAYLIVPLRKKAYSLRLNARFKKDEQLRGMGERFIPILIGMGISQLYTIVERILASGLGDQKVTTLILARGIIDLPIAIFAGALAVPLFPLLAEYVKNNQMEQMKSILNKGLLYQYHVLLPATLGFVLLSEEIVSFFYDFSGNFTQEDARLVGWAMFLFSFSMVFRGGRDLLIRASYAIENTRTPVVIGGVCVVFYIVASVVLIRPLDYAGLALAYSLANMLNLLLQSVFLQRQIGRLYQRSFYISIGRGFIAVLVMSIGIWLLQSPTATWGKLQVPVLIIIAAGLYGIMLYIMKEQLLKEIVDLVKKRLKIGGGANGS